MLSEVGVGALDLGRLAALLDPDDARHVRERAVHGRELLDGRSVWNVNSTARGGGVAEMLQTLLAYAQGVGVDARWLVIGGDPEFFTVTKRIHNRLHGAAGDGGPLGDPERLAYERAMTANAAGLLERVRPGDVVILHDPQTAGLAGPLKDAGIPVIWRCHVGVDHPNELAREAWEFLAPHVRRADLVVFSREQFAWDVVDPERRRIIAPSIDALAPKNQDLAGGAVGAILEAAALRERIDGAVPAFRRFDGSTGTVTRRARVHESRPLPAGQPYVLQVSRWDRLKDPIGVIEGFAHHIAPHTSAELIYAGPDVEAVTDDPEGAEVLRLAREVRDGLESPFRERVHLALLPMDDLEENAAIVNALQRDASVVVQKSLAEGFGLTVAEAMWKSRPVVASRIGGIADQIEHGRSGLLLRDPADMVEYGAAVRRLLNDPAEAAAMGSAARERVRRRFLGTHSLLDYLELLEELIGARP